MNRRTFFRGLTVIATAVVIPLKALDVGVFRDTVVPDSILQVIADNCAKDIENYVFDMFLEGGSI